MIDNSKLILTDTLYFWYPIFLISDISDTRYFWYPIYFRYIWYGTWYFWYPYFWYPIFIIPDINDTQYIWYFWYMNLFLIPNRGHYYAACAIFYVELRLVSVCTIALQIFHKVLSLNDNLRYIVSRCLYGKINQ